MDQDLTVDKQKTLTQKFKESIIWIYLSFLVLYGIMMIVFLASLSTELTDLQQSEGFILARESINQWGKNFMIELAAKDGECPGGYENLIQYQWAGTVAGCGCDFTANNITQTIVVKGQCNSELLGFGCFDIEEQSPITGQKWKNSKNLCALRDKYNMINSLDQECELGNVVTKNYKKCGSGSKAVCRPSSSECPISHIQNKLNYVGDHQAKELDIDDDIIYTYESDLQGFLPIVDFRFDEYAHCLNPNQRNISPDKTGEYILLNERRENCPQEETRTSLLDSLGEEDLFKNNIEIWNIATNNLPGYPRPSNYYTYKLSYQAYPYWSFECRNSDIYNLKNSVVRLQLDNEIEQEEYLLVTTIISIVFVSFILIIIEVFKQIKRSRENTRFLQAQSDVRYYTKLKQKVMPVKNRQWLNNTIAIIIFDKVFKIVNVFSIFIVYVELQDAKSWFEGVQKYKCGDDYFFQKIYYEYESSIYDMFQNIEAMMGLWWSVIVLDIAFLIFRYLHEIRPVILELKGYKERNLKTKSKDQLKLQQKVHKERVIDQDDIVDNDDDIMGDSERLPENEQNQNDEKQLQQKYIQQDKQEIEMQGISDKKDKDINSLKDNEADDLIDDNDLDVKDIEEDQEIQEVKQQPKKNQKQQNIKPPKPTKTIPKQQKKGGKKNN